MGKLTCKEVDKTLACSRLSVSGVHEKKLHVSERLEDVPGVKFTFHTPKFYAKSPIEIHQVWPRSNMGTALQDLGTCHSSKLKDLQEFFNVDGHTLDTVNYKSWADMFTCTFHVY